MTTDSRIIAEMHETIQSLHAGGLIDERRMREFEALHGAGQVPKYNADSIKALRSRLHVSQAALAMIINTSAATVRAWEAGTKSPGGPSCKLLELLDRKGLEALL